MAECSSSSCEVEEASPAAAEGLPLPAFNRTLRPVQEFVVGYTCAFTDPPKELRTECPICLFILREPYQATCCGSIYCKLCIKRVRDDLKPCPACRDASFDIFPDRGLRNSLYDFKVLCTHKDSGCTWTGELRYIDDHLNVDPKPEHRFFGCEYVEGACSMCGKSLPRGKLEEHEMKKCPGREYTCEYCGDYTATFEKVAEKHWPECPSRSVPCPNDCGVYPEKKNMEHHLRYDCELRELEPETMSPNEIRKCIDSAIKSQLPSFAAEFLKKALKDEIGKELKVVEELHEAITNLKHMKEESEKLRAELEELKLKHLEDRESISTLKSHFAIVPISFTLDDYKNRHMHREMGWTSPPFYTHPRGYRMCLLIDVGGPAGHPKGVYMSVYLNLTRGEYDSQLKWPFRGSVTVSLLSQGSDKCHHVEVIKYHENTPSATSGKVQGDNKISKPWGKGKFIRHDELNGGGFVVNDELKFQISKVLLDA